MFAARETPAPREPHATIRITLPVRLIAELNRRAEARAGILKTISQSRDALMAELLADALQHRGEALQHRCNRVQPTGTSNRGA